MKHLMKLTIIATLFSVSGILQAQDITGKWTSIDDETGQAKSTVNIYIEDGKMYGQIVEIFGAEPDKKCDCTGDKADQPIVGMIIIDGLEEHSEYWKKDDGIFDPEKDTYYDVRIWQENDKLMVRGYVGFLFRTQIWVRK